jgi:Flp pilus assembly protein TadD
LRWAAALGFIFVLACAGHWGARHEQLFFDDGRITQDPVLTDFAQTWQRFRQYALYPGQQLTDLTFAGNYALNVALGRPGWHADGFFRVNVGLHGVNACLVLLLVSSLLRQAHGPQSSTLGVALVVAALFAVHPLQVSGVGYIVQRRGLISVLFYLLALLSHLGLRGAGSAAGRVGYAAALAASAYLAAKAKTMGLTLPFAVLAQEACLRAPDRRAILRMLRWLVPAAVLTFIGLLAFLHVQGLFDFRRFRILSVGPTGLWGLWPHILTQARVLLHFWKLLLLPLPAWLSIDHPFELSRHLMEHGALWAMILHGAIMGTGILAAVRRLPLAGFGILLFYIAVIPWVFVPQTELLVEYKTYLCAVGAGCLVADLLHHLRSRVAFHVPAIAAAAVAGWFFTITLERSRLYADPVLLWGDVCKKSPGHVRARVSLADALANAGRYDEAVQAYRDAFRLEPYNSYMHFMLANTLRDAGRLEEAVAAYRESRRIAPGDLHVYTNLGDVLSRLGRHQEAILELEAGLRYRTADTDAGIVAKAEFNLANTFAARGRWEAAATHYREAIARQPGHVNAHYGLGLALAGLGRLDEAIAEYHAALRLDPHHPHAGRALQQALLQKGPPTAGGR